MNISMLRTRWAAIGAAVAVTLGAGGLGISYATSPAGATAYVPITPCRIADTRPAPDNVGPRNTPIGAGQTLTISAHGDNGNCTAANGNSIPNTATGLQLNVTAIGATSGSFLTVWATGATQPTASSLNPQPGAPPIPNAVTTGLSAGGQFNIFNAAGSVNVFVDVVGYYTDHNHDDRYYTEAEVNTLLNAKDDSDAAFDTNSTTVGLSTTDTVVATVTVATPTSGYITVNSGGFVGAASVDTLVRCSITTGTTVDFNASINVDLPLSGLTRHGIATTRGFVENKAFVIFGDDNQLTVNLVCSTTAGTASYFDSTLTAIFTPDPDAFGFVLLPSEASAPRPEDN